MNQNNLDSWKLLSSPLEMVGKYVLGLPRRSANTNMEVESRQKKEHIFLNMQTYFTFLQGWFRQGLAGNLEKLDKPPCL